MTENEIQELIRQNEMLSEKLNDQTQLSKKVVRLFRFIFFGRSLNNSVYKFQNELINSKSVNLKTSSEVIAGVIRRLTWVGIFAIIPAIILVFQTYQLHKQNNLIDGQNSLITTQNATLENQNFLIESSRRSSYVLLLTNLFTSIENELKISLDRELTSATINKIISTSNFLKPYKYLDIANKESKVIENPLSPERSQLFQYLLSTNLGPKSIKRILRFGNFEYSDLSNSNLSGLEIEGGNLNFSNFEGANLEGIKFRNSNIRYSNFRYANMNEVEFIDTEIYGSNLIKSKMTKEWWVKMKTTYKPVELDSIQSDEISKELYSKLNENINMYIIDSYTLESTGTTVPMINVNYESKMRTFYQLKKKSDTLGLMHSNYWKEVEE